MAVAVIGGTTAHRPGTTTGSTPATETLSLYSPSGQPGMRARTNPFDAAAHTLCAIGIHTAASPSSPALTSTVTTAVGELIPGSSPRISISVWAFSCAALGVTVPGASGMKP